MTEKRTDLRSDVLSDLGLTIEQTPTLASNQRSRLLNFLLRWEYLGPLHGCLDLLLSEKPDLVSLIDLRVRALVIAERHPEAIDLMVRRLGVRSSLTAQALMARVYLAADRVDDACAIAQRVQESAPDRVTTWYIGAETALANDDVSGALAAYQRVNETYPGRSGYLLGMMQLYQAQEDYVSASGYAVRLLSTADHPEDLAIGYLRKLRAYFVASDEQTHVQEIDDAIEAHYARQLQDLKDALGDVAPAEPAAPALTQAADDDTTSVVAATLRAGTAISITLEEEARITGAVHELYGFDGLLPGQLETMARVLRDENVLTVLPTGGGKSLCYQVPAMLAADGLTLVVSPLIALMKDQVDSLPEAIRSQATTINSSAAGDVLRHRLSEAARGAYRLLYAAPERMRQPAFLHALRRAGINRLVIDEAHCVSIWGHDFRPDYLKLRDAWESLGEPPILALTATAPPRVRLDIIQHLSPDRPMATVTGDLTRSNLRLEVFRAHDLDEKLERVLTFCKDAKGSGIVYAGTRARCEELARLLREQGVDATHYHAGIPNRAEVQEAFMAGQARVIVATIAFGMGIDKPDIRFIIHFMPPASLESYYQEAGRAGRDGLPARCLLMVSNSDRGVMTRRMRRDLPTVDSLREVYSTVLRYLGPDQTRGIAAANLARDLGLDDTRLRVAVSILEENGLLERGPDTPRAAMVTARRSPPSDGLDDGRLATFHDIAHLQIGRPLRVDTVSAAHGIGIAPQQMEGQLLAWADAGQLECRFSGRDMLITRLPPPDDVAARIDQWLDRFESLQVQRIAEIVGYARTRRCRHGHINAYLGGRQITRCEACDNCVKVADEATSGLPTQTEQLKTILQCAAGAPWSWGEVSLTRILRGERDAPERARDHPGFGALSYRSRGAVSNLLDQLVDTGFFRARQLGNGGTVLDITDKGRRALRQPALLKEAVRARPGPIGEPQAVPQGPIPLFDMLSNWRLEEARRQGVQPFRIIQLQVLHRIAARRPRTLDALLAVKGIGPRRLDTYGEAILDVINAYQADDARAEGSQ